MKQFSFAPPLLFFKKHLYFCFKPHTCPQADTVIDHSNLLSWYFPMLLGGLFLWFRQRFFPLLFLFLDPWPQGHTSPWRWCCYEVMTDDSRIRCLQCFYFFFLCFILFFWLANLSMTRWDLFGCSFALVWLCMFWASTARLWSIIALKISRPESRVAVLTWNGVTYSLVVGWLRICSVLVCFISNRVYMCFFGWRWLLNCYA